MNNKRIVDILDKYGTDTVSRMVAILQANNKATERMLKHLRHEVVDDVKYITLTVYAAPESIFVDGGRKPNSLPPPVKFGAFLEWCKRKGVEKKKYAIAKNIGKYGIKAVPFLDEITKGLTDSEIRFITDATSESLAEDLRIATDKVYREIDAEYQALKALNT